jgi:hypothetical protein
MKASRRAAKTASASPDDLRDHGSNLWLRSVSLEFRLYRQCRWAQMLVPQRIDAHLRADDDA